MHDVYTKRSIVHARKSAAENGKYTYIGVYTTNVVRRECTVICGVLCNLVLSGEKKEKSDIKNYYIFFIYNINFAAGRVCVCVCNRRVQFTRFYRR